MATLARCPRLEKLRDWRRNRLGGRRWDRSDPRWPERITAGRPWEGRSREEAHRQKGGCWHKGCWEMAVATVPGYPRPLPLCFTHEREYVDRYGHEGVYPL